MEPITIGLLVGLIVQAAAGEVGKSAWSGLTHLTRRAFRDDEVSTRALETAAADEAGATELAGGLVRSAADDPAFEELLRSWIAHTQQAATGEAVVNTISGGAQVHGHAVQARDVGSVHLGGTDRPAS